jgi:AcrR family transcriptional regulator
MATPQQHDDVDPRVARTRDAVRDAVRSLVRQAGVEAVTHQRVAAAAGIGRATVYRHWPHRTHLLLDALAELDTAEPWHSSGELAVDLARALGRLQRALNGSPFVAELIALIGRAEWDPELRGLQQQLLARGTDGLRRALEAGIDDGELPCDLDVDHAVARLAGPLFYGRVLARSSIDDRFVDEVVAAFLRSPSSPPRG